MTFSARVSKYQESMMLNICDKHLLGEHVVQRDLDMHVSQGCYGGMWVDDRTATELLRNSSIINMVGDRIISMSISLGIGSKESIRTISGIPFLIVFKM